MKNGPPKKLVSQSVVVRIMTMHEREELLQYVMLEVFQQLCNFCDRL